MKLKTSSLHVCKRQQRKLFSQFRGNGAAVREPGPRTSAADGGRDMTGTTASRRGEQGTAGGRAGGTRTSPTEEITFDLFGGIEDFNDAVTSGDRTEKVR
jgi:hypothetical protein